MILVQFFWANCSFALVRSFDISDLSNSLTVPHLSWAIWVNCSQSLIWFEWSEQMSDEQMSEFPALFAGPQEIECSVYTQVSVYVTLNFKLGRVMVVFIQAA